MAKAEEDRSALRPRLSFFLPYTLPVSDALSQNFLHVLRLLPCFFAPIAGGESLGRFPPILRQCSHRVRCLCRAGARRSASHFTLPEIIGLLDRGNHTVLTHTSHP